MSLFQTNRNFFFLSFNLTNAFSFLLRLRLFFFNKNENISYTVSYLNSPSRKNNSCMYCMPMILLFVQSTVSSFLYLELFFFTALFDSFVQLNLVHSSFSPLIKYFVKIMLNAFLVSV